MDNRVDPTGMSLDYREGGLYLPWGGTIRGLAVDVGTDVEAGDTVLFIKLDDRPVTTPVSGKITSIYVQPDQTAQWGTLAFGIRTKEAEAPAFAASNPT